ncbi:MAG TPA: hypothetical protein VIK91_27555 [Nannocystis sp.]
MTFSIYRHTRSARLTVTVPGGQKVVVENMIGDTGFSLEFEVRRTMDESPGEFTVVAYNLPPDALAAIEHAQVKRVDDIDALLVGQNLTTSSVAADGSDALAAGWPIVELEAGYDGTVSRVFRAIGAKIRSDKSDGLTTRTEIVALENLDGPLLGLPSAVFPAGSTVFEVVDYLRRVAGLGTGNLSFESLTAIIGLAKLDSPYAVSGGDALKRLKQVLEWMPVRWFVDDREIWICGRDDVPAILPPVSARASVKTMAPRSAPAYVPGEPEEPDLILARPVRVDGGRVQVECLLCPRILPGRLVRLSESGLALALQGLSPTETQAALAQVPPGLYRCDEVSHRGATSGADWTTAMTLRPGVATGA